MKIVALRQAAACSVLILAAFAEGVDRKASSVLSSPSVSDRVIAGLDYRLPRPTPAVWCLFRQCGCHTFAGHRGLDLGQSGDYERNMNFFMKMGRQRTPEWIAVQIRHPNLHHGAMPPFTRTQISDSQLQALALYLSTLKQPDIPSALFLRKDLLDPTDLLLRMKKSSDPLSRYIRDHLYPGRRLIPGSSDAPLREDPRTVTVRTALDRYDGAAPPPENLTEAIRKEINDRLLHSDLYRLGFHARLRLSNETQRLIAYRSGHEDRWGQSPERQNALILLNRLILTDAFPGELARFAVTID